MMQLVASLKHVFSRGKQMVQPLPDVQVYFLYAATYS